MDFSKNIFLFFILISVSHTKNIKDILEFRRVPRIVFFDLDYTLWPYWVDTDVVPPFHYNNDTRDVTDDNGVFIRGYPEVPQVFKWLQKHLIPMGILSSSIADIETKVILDLLEWTKLFEIIEINPRSEDKTIMKLSENKSIPLEDMILFDDEPHIKTLMDPIGVITEEVIKGMNMKTLLRGLKKFSDIRSGQHNGPHPNRNSNHK